MGGAGHIKTNGDRAFGGFGWWDPNPFSGHEEAAWALAEMGDRSQLNRCSTCSATWKKDKWKSTCRGCCGRFGKIRERGGAQLPAKRPLTILTSGFAGHAANGLAKLH